VSLVSSARKLSTVEGSSPPQARTRSHLGAHPLPCCYRREDSVQHLSRRAAGRRLHHRRDLILETTPLARTDDLRPSIEMLSRFDACREARPSRIERSWRLSYGLGPRAMSLLSDASPSADLDTAQARCRLASARPLPGSSGVWLMRSNNWTKSGSG